MSFPKAKVQRFNEVKVTTPSPADYNVKTGDNKTKFGTIPQSGRFTEPESPVRSETRSETSSNQSITFRTPTLPKKKKNVFQSFLSKSAKASAKESKIQQQQQITTDNEELKDKIVECKNKDVFIKELHEQIDEMNGQICELNKQKSQLDVDKLQLVERTESLQIEHQQAIENEELRHQKEYERIQLEMMKINEERLSIRKECDQLKSANRENILDLLVNIDKFDKLYAQSTNEYQNELRDKNTIIESKDVELKKLNDECMDLKRKHSVKIETLHRKYEEKIEFIKNEVQDKIMEMNQFIDDRMNETLVKIKSIESQQMDKIKDLIAMKKQQSDAKLKQIQDDHLKTEIQTQQKIKDLENSWKLKIDAQEKQSEAILKECQAISEYNIIQSEVEKNAIKLIVDELQTKLNADQMYQQYKSLQFDYKQLQNDLSKIIVELNEARRQHDVKMNEQLSIIKKQSVELHKYEVTIKTSQDTIEVLKKRLINSDSDVEQLKEELAESEARILTYEAKCLQLTNDLNLSLTANDELEMQYEASVELNQHEIEQVKSTLFEKLDDVIEASARAITTCDNQKDEYQNRIVTLEQQLVELKAEKIQVNEEHQREMNSLQEKCNSYQQYNDYYKGKSAETDKELEEAAELRKKFIEQSGKHDELLQKYEELFKENEVQKKIIADQVSLIGPFREQLEAYKTQQQSLLDEKLMLENETKAIGIKYAEIVGHQNHKQKIKHLIDLKAKNIELKQTNTELDSKLTQAKKVIEKCKQENQDLKKRLRKFQSPHDKENLSSPNVSSLNSSWLSPAPLRERN